MGEHIPLDTLLVIKLAFQPLVFINDSGLVGNRQQRLRSLEV